MPIYALQLLQPLDVNIFSPLKKAYRKFFEDLMTANNNHINKKDILSLYLDIYIKVCISVKICSSFAGDKA